MANQFRPKVTTLQSVVQIGRQLALRDMFTVTDLDPDSQVLRYRIRDNSSVASGGFFVKAGVRQPSGTFVEFNSTELSSVYYRAGLIIGNESFTMQVWDGQFWSAVDSEQVYSVTLNTRRPFVRTEVGRVVSNEKIPITDVIDAFDPDGFIITKYQFVDRLVNGNGGFFEVNGVRQPSGRWFTVDAENLSQVMYIAGSFGPQSENIGVMAKDQTYWSNPKDVRIFTRPNTSAPEISTFRVKAAVGRILDFRTMFEWSDVDANTAKVFGFRDSGVGNGFFTIDGVRQPALEWITIPAADATRVKYVTADFNAQENVTIGVMDGRFWSTSTNVISGTTRPSIDSDSVFIVNDTVDETPISEIFRNGDISGEAFTRYQIFDYNETLTSGKLLLNGVPLQNGEWHDISAAEWNNLEFQSAPSFPGRTRDRLVARGFNGVFWSDIATSDIITDPVGPDSLIIPPDSGPTPFGRNWQPFWNDDFEGPTVITYNFDETQPFDTSMRAATREVLSEIEYHTNIRFVERSWTVDTVMEFALADINDGVGGTLAFAFIPFGNGLRGDPTENAGNSVYDIADYPFGATDTSRGSSFRATLIHEIGHTMGFDHPFESANPLPTSVDFDYNSVMSYSRDFVFHPEEPSSMMLFDVQQAQRLYGPNMNHMTGNDHYFLGPGDEHLITLWDAGGIDTFNMTNSLVAEDIDLREGEFTRVNGVDNSVRIAYGTVIENARGGRANDVIQGNDVRNLLWGNQGNDVLIGGGGNDLLRGGAQDDRYLWTVGDGRDTIREDGQGGMDTIEISDITGNVNSLEDDFVFYRIGDTLRIDLTMDRGQALGTVQVQNFNAPGSEVELLRIFDNNNQQIGDPIELNSAFLQAGTSATRFRATDIVGETGGVLVTPFA